MSDAKKDPDAPDNSTDDADREPVSLALATYLRLRGLKAPRRRKRRFDPSDENQPFTPGRDPLGLGDAVDTLTREAGWGASLAREDVLLQWTQVAGEETAAHARPMGLEHGVLTVRCDSTAWAKQLSYLRGELITRMREAHPEAGIEQVRFVGPDAPSWKWGHRTVPGRGPRDTYG
ncbi:DciA family protein [uncultured Microbacterium sp.]|uniref:DUF721 domain-containing protein n=1 Tax=uncultured Microbacterium sp. TaxID=191216 RepID=UPI0025F802D4|nr:DciA family protein [uncultured Microbacterium sp.]